MPAHATSLLIVVGAYLLGSLSGSLLFGRLRGVDIRTLGSGNAGGTNALRARGWKFAAVVVVFDIGKGAIAAWLGLRLAPYNPELSVTAHGYAAAFAATIGHVWPVWHGFRGGKGAATAVGGVLVLWPWITPLLFVMWVLVIMFGGYVGLATVLAGLMLAFAAWMTDATPPRLIFSMGVALLLAFTHRDNMRRLLNGTELRFERARLLHRIWRHRR